MKSVNNKRVTICFDWQNLSKARQKTYFELRTLVALGTATKKQIQDFIDIEEKRTRTWGNGWGRLDLAINLMPPVNLERAKYATVKEDKLVILKAAIRETENPGAQRCYVPDSDVSRGVRLKALFVNWEPPPPSRWARGMVVPSPGNIITSEAFEEARERYAENP
jgi:hypothetical protein